jgi:trk system potassium uptake protein TrkH
MVDHQSRRSPSHHHTSPANILFLSLTAVIIVGAALLALPFAQHKAVSLFDALFTSVSTVCVTGLSVVPINNFSFYGQLIILILMQIGGLGIMTFSFFIASLFLNLGMTSKLIAGQMFEFESWNKIKTFLVTIIVATISIEGIGAALLFKQFKSFMPTGQAAFYAVFHAVSAFCNAGISLFDSSLTTMGGNFPVLGIIAFLVLAGGIGFIVWYEVAYAINNIFLWLRNKSCPLFTFSLHTKLVLIASSFLILVGTIGIWSLEYLNSFKEMSSLDGWINALFLSISMRSAGFVVTDITAMTHATILLLMILMVIGASPGSTGSGIKTTNFVLFCASVKAIIQNRDSVELYGRTIPNDQMQKVIGVVTITLSCTFLCTFALLILEPHHNFLALVFEALSAFSTCGITLGITHSLSLASKIILMITMMIGRIGILTLVLSLRKRTPKHLYKFPEERVLLG